MDKIKCKPKLNIYLLQHPRVEINGKNILKELTGKAAVLILYLAANSNKEYSRDVLSELLWPDIPTENAKANLRQILFGIKKICTAELGYEESMVGADKSTCGINKGLDIFIDLPIFYKGMGDGIRDKNIVLLQKSLDLYVGNFVEGLYVKGSAALDEWILFERESVGRTLRDGGKILAGLYEQQEEYHRAVQCLNKLIKTDPLQEDIYRDLMRVHYKNGERNQTIAQFNQCTKILRRELNISPMEETKRLYEKLLIEEPLKSRAELAEGSGDTGQSQGKQCARGMCVVGLSANPFGNLPYEGIFKLMEAVDTMINREYEQVNTGVNSRDGGGYPWLTQKADGSELGFMQMLVNIKNCIEKLGKNHRLHINVEDYSKLDLQTQKLIRFLQGNLTETNVVIEVKPESWENTVV